MFKVSKEFSFDMAHLLDGHDGKCQNLHGHTYKLQVEVQGELHASGAKKGMVMDFSDLKQIVKEQILTPMDHAFIYDETSERESKIAQLLQDLNSKTFAMPTRTTAEEMARFIFQRLSAHLPISAIRLWETPTSFCEYRENKWRED
ncbi:6-carboxytetrahydropterin synthase QueD [Avibacterium avium]